MADADSPTAPAPEKADIDVDAPVGATDPATDLVEADLLVEDVSIDGMCGVY
jgi:mycofactocin precursor